MYSAFALTEPEHADSDPTCLSTTAVRDGDEWIINGHKWFVSNASTADFIIVVNGTAGSGFDALIGLEYIELSPDRVQAKWTVSPNLHQPEGIQHGGVYCAVVESVGSVGGALRLGTRGHVVGVNNTTDFLRATRQGVLTAVGTPLFRGRSQQLWDVTITDEMDRPVATGRANITDTAHLGGSRPVLAAVIAEQTR